MCKGDARVGGAGESSRWYWPISGRRAHRSHLHLKIAGGGQSGPGGRGRTRRSGWEGWGAACASGCAVAPSPAVSELTPGFSVVATKKQALTIPRSESTPDV
eukprot:1177479-Prorocentrum_minimum.AAC.2